MFSEREPGQQGSTQPEATPEEPIETPETPEEESALTYDSVYEMIKKLGGIRDPEKLIRVIV